MVWIVVVVLVMLGAGWYMWGTANIASSPTITADMATTTATSTPSTATTTQPQNNSTAPMSATVTYNGRTFSPATVTIQQGGTVTFTDTAGTMWVAADEHPTHTDYDGTSKAQHCASGYAGEKPFDQCTPGASYSFVFKKVGTIEYHDHLNAGAEGVVVVTP